MEAVFAGIMGGWKVTAILGVIMLLAAIGVASLVVIAVCLWRRSSPARGTSLNSGQGQVPNRS